MANEINYRNTLEYHLQQELISSDKEYTAIHLNETDETRENAISKIKCWIKNELKEQIPDDLFILRFLRVCKFNLEKTKIRIQNLYKLRTDLPEWFTNLDPLQPILQELLDIGICLPLRKTDNQGRLVILVRSQHDPKKHKIVDVIKVLLLTIEVAIKKNYSAASVYGCAIYIDAINTTIHHVLQCGPIVLKNAIHAWQNCNPIRLQLISVINTPIILDVSFKIIKSFMSEKLKSRLHVYPYMLPSCFKDIPANILPIEYGGTDGTTQELIEYWKKLVEENRDWLMTIVK